MLIYESFNCHYTNCTIGEEFQDCLWSSWGGWYSSSIGM